MSRTLDEIVAAVEAGETPSADEMFYAVAALSNLLGHYAQDLVDLIERGHSQLAPLLEAHTKRRRGAGCRAPQLWLGPQNDPRCPEYQEWHRQQDEARRRTLH